MSELLSFSSLDTLTLAPCAFAIRQLLLFDTLGRHSSCVAGARPPLPADDLGRPELFCPAELRLDQLVLPAQQGDLRQHGIGGEQRAGGVGGHRQGGSRGQAAEGEAGEAGHGAACLGAAGGLQGIQRMFLVLRDRRRPCRREGWGG